MIVLTYLYFLKACYRSEYEHSRYRKNQNREDQHSHNAQNNVTWILETLHLTI